MNASTKKLPHYIARLAQDLGFLDERKYRDFCICEQFEQLRQDGLTVEKIELKLSLMFTTKKDKLSPESIHQIIYRKK